MSSSLSEAKNGAVIVCASWRPNENFVWGGREMANALQIALKMLGFNSVKPQCVTRGLILERYL